MAKKPVTVLVVRVGQAPKVEVIHQDLRSLYKLLDCTIVQCVPIGCGFDIWCDEEGLFGKPFNSCGIVGDYFISRNSRSGYISSLTEKQIEQALNYYNAYRLSPHPGCAVTLVGFESVEKLFEVNRAIHKGIDDLFRAAQTVRSK